MSRLLSIQTDELENKGLDYDVVNLSSSDLTNDSVDLASSELESISVSTNRLQALEAAVAELQSEGNVRYDTWQVLTNKEKLQARTNIGAFDNDRILINTTEYWNSRVGYIPPEGTIIVYTDKATSDGINVPAIKVGSGNGYVQDLAFVSGGMEDQLFQHITDTIIHITQEERVRWNNKINIDDAVTEVSDETLIFTRN